MSLRSLVVFVSVASVVCQDDAVNIPPSLSLEDFKTHVDGRVLVKTFQVQSLGLPEAKPSLMKISAMATGKEHTFLFQLWGDMPPPFYGHCQEINFTMSLMNENEMTFLGDIETNHVSVFTTDAELHIWLIRCAMWKPGTNVCPRNELYIYLYKNGDKNTQFPQNNFKLLGILLGDPGLKWYKNMAPPEHCSAQKLDGST